MSNQMSYTNPDTPVLVFRSASGRTEVARRAEGFSVHVLTGSDRLDSADARRLGRALIASETERLARALDPRALPEQPPAIGPNGAPDGLFQKFVCYRRDGKDQPGGPKQGAWYFVLDCFNDPYARTAALAYAAACEEELPELAADLRSVLASWEPVPEGHEK